MKLLESLRRSRPIDQNAVGKILPFDVRYALTYGGANLGQPEIATMAANGLYDETVYLIAKAQTHDLTAQRRFMTDVVDLSINGGTGLGDFLCTETSRLPSDTHVEGGKLALLNGQGFENWQKAYARLARHYAQQDEVHTPVLIAHATYVGLREFVTAFAGTDRLLLTLVPEWIDDPSQAQCGYVIHPDSLSEKVRFLPKDFPRPTDASLVDDLIRSGEHARKISAFWGDNITEKNWNFMVRRTMASVI